MTITERLLQISRTLSGRTIETAEQVSQGVVMPILQALGYDVFDPTAVIADYSVNPERKKNERADHAVIIDGEARFLLKVRGGTAQLEAKQIANLSTEFSLGTARFIFQVNAQWLDIYSDLDQEGVIDLTPMVSLDLRQLDADGADRLAQFSLEAFDGDAIRTKADTNRLSGALVGRLSALIEAPTPAFLGVLLNGVVAGTPSDDLLDRCGPYLSQGYKDLVAGEVRARILRALDDTPAKNEVVGAASTSPSANDDTAVLPEEADGLRLIRAIAFGLAEPADIDVRPNQSYAAILYKDNNRRTIARLHLKRSVWYLGLLDSDQTETRHQITGVDNIFAYAEQIRAAVARHSKGVVEARPAKTDPETPRPDADEKKADEAAPQVVSTEPDEPVVAAPAEVADHDSDSNGDQAEVAAAPSAEAEPDNTPITQPDEVPVILAGLAATPAEVVEEQRQEQTTAEGQVTDGVLAHGNLEDDLAPELSLDDFDAIHASIVDEVGGEGTALNEDLEALINSPINGIEADGLVARG